MVKPDNKNEAVNLIQGRHFNTAKSLLSRLCDQAPLDPDLWYMRAYVSGQLGEHDRVIEYGQRTLAIKPEYNDVFASLASAQATLGHNEAAVESYNKAIRFTPENIDLRICLSEVLRRMAKFKAAEDQLYDASKLGPENTRILLQLGRIHYQCGNLQKALTCFQRLVQLEPEDPIAWAHLGSTFSWTMGCEQEAADALTRARTLAPDNARIIGKQARSLEIAGDFEGAYSCVRELLDRGEKDLIYAAEVYANICHKVGDCKEAAEVLESLLDSSLSETDPFDFSTAHFSLGKLYDRMGKYDLAFAHYRQANEHPPPSWDPSAYQETISKVIASFGREQLMEFPRSGNTSSRPVFIVGMQRSGTSLVEQILSSHPSVHGAGELVFIHDSVRILMQNNEYPEDTSGITKSFLEQQAAAYLSQPAMTDNTALRVTDKLPSNHIHLGLISLLFPNSRVIHCRRNPLDTGLSMYFQNFGGSCPYSNTLQHIGVYYREYLRIMEHWKQVLDIPVYEVTYEDLIDKQESISRELVEFCGIDWDPACLEFYKADRTITTSSYDQVRRPLYRSSVERWKHYEAHIGELKDILGLGLKTGNSLEKKNSF